MVTTSFIFRLSPQSIDALADVISGGSANDPSPPVGFYRSGPKIEKFMRECNVELNIGSQSRLTALVECLVRINNSPEGHIVLTKIIEKAVDPRGFTSEPAKHSAVVGHLNQFLAYDELEVRDVGKRTILCHLGKSVAVVDHLATKIELVDFDTVGRDLDRALNSCEKDPEDAVTAACSAVESVCRSVLIELGLELPAKQDISGLYKAVRDPLGLSPLRSDLPGEVADDVRKILSGMTTMIDGIGSLRTHGGDAHGRERGFARIDARIARLAIHSASTAALFIIETWQRKYPSKPLVRHFPKNPTISR